MFSPAALAAGSLLFLFLPFFSEALHAR